MSSRLSTWFGVYRWSFRRCSSKMYQGGRFGGDRSRFGEEGLFLRANLLCKQVAPDARGHRLCQDTTGRLKEAVRACRQHKQRVQLAICLLGIRIRDEKAWALLHHHPVNRISFISQDASDARVVTYVCVARDDAYHYIAIKTEKAATELEAALVAVFKEVLDMKERASRIAPQEWRHHPKGWAQTPSPRRDVNGGISSLKTASIGESLAPRTIDTVDELTFIKNGTGGIRRFSL
ncbi:hypothetical protein V5799_022111, partial [Amblyomma americanum]